MSEIPPGYVRVSEVLSIIPSMIGRDEQGKPIWGYPMNDIDREILKNAAERGSRIHAAISGWHQDAFYPLDSQDQGFYESFVKWAKIVDLKPLKSEFRLNSGGMPMKLSGQIDMLGQIRGSNNARLIDFKCTAQEDEKKWRVQASLYSILLNEAQYAHDKEALFVRLDRNGGLPQVCKYELTINRMAAAIAWYSVYKDATGK